MATETKPKRRSKAADKWRESHDHAHEPEFKEHAHHEGQSDDDQSQQHADLVFDQGPEANREVDPDGPPTPGDVENGETHEEDIGRPLAGRSSTGESPQAAFDDVVVDLKTDSGKKLLEAFEMRASTIDAHRSFGAADRDIKKIMAELGHYNGQPINVRVGAHLFSLVATSDDRPIEAGIRHGSQRKSITHPD